jgi:hypothetical protein
MAGALTAGNDAASTGWEHSDGTIRERTAGPCKAGTGRYGVGVLFLFAGFFLRRQPHRLERSDPRSGSGVRGTPRINGQPGLCCLQAETGSTSPQAMWHPLRDGREINIRRRSVLVTVRQQPGKRSAQARGMWRGSP